MSTDSSTLTPGLHPAHVADIQGSTSLSLANDRRSSAACRHCRARKVKCDRVEPCCAACTRLGFPCSFAGDVGNIDVHVTEPAFSLTQAGTKRKRSRQACKGCKAVKVKCSGGNPCERCLSRGNLCEDLAEIQEPEQRSWLGPSPDQVGLSTPGTLGSLSSTNSALLDKPVVRRYLEAYLDSTSLSGCDIFLKPFVLADWSKGKLSPLLLKVLVASGLRLADELPESQATARTWIREAQNDLLRNVGRQNIAQLQALIVIIRFHYATGDVSDAWNLLSLAARLAFTMRLNWEDETLDSVTQETRRRLVWAIYLTDRQFSGGVEDLAVCPVERMHIRLPCDSHSFRRGIKSQADFLNGPAHCIRGTMDILSYNIRLTASRDRVLRYTKQVRREGASPADSREEMEKLHQELDGFAEDLPDDLKLNSERLLFMAHSDEASEYIVLHTIWLQCYCDLYRFLIPGIRESVPRKAIDQTPSSLVEFCQKACLDKAIRLCDFWFETYQLEPSQAINDMFFIISIYQVCQILYHLQHMLPEEGVHSIENLKAKLEGALQLAESLRTAFRRSAACLKASERLVMILGQDVPLQSRPSSVDEAENQHHLPSKHSFISTMSRKPREADDDETSEAASPTRFDMADRPAHADDFDFPGGTTTQTNLTGFGGHSSGRVPVLSMSHGGMAPWDPFDMQMNDYYDPELGDLLMSITR